MQQNRIDPSEAQENFPVASQLLPAEWRQPILNFYSYVRGLDNIADDPHTKREEIRDELRRVRLGVEENQPEMLPDWARGYHQRIQHDATLKNYGDMLWKAFWQDTEKQRYRNFSEVIDYCKLSAMPVGRMVLHVSGESSPNIAASDALCAALQLINHLQDAREDYLRLERLYIPQSWLENAGVSEKVFEKAETGPKLRSVFNLWLDEVDKLLRQAGNLPKSIHHRGLRWECRIILAYARALSRKLRKKDVMAHRVRLSNMHKAWLAIGAVIGVC